MSLVTLLFGKFKKVIYNKKDPVYPVLPPVIIIPVAIAVLLVVVIVVVCVVEEVVVVESFVTFVKDVEAFVENAVLLFVQSDIVRLPII